MGHPVTGAAAEPLGRVATVFTDPASGTANWVAVETAPGTTVLVPLGGASADGPALRVPFDAEQLRTAPPHDPAADLSHEQAAALTRHYAEPRPLAADRAGSAAPVAAEDGGWLVRHEEQLRVVTGTAVTGRVRVRKRVITEERTFTVEVTREEVTIEREDVPAAEQVVVAAGDPGTELGEQVVEIVRYEERVLVTKEVVPVERIRMTRHLVTEPRVLRGTVRREELEVQDDRTDPDRSGPRG